MLFRSKKSHELRSVDFEQEHKPKNFKTQKIILAHIYYQLHVGFQAIGSARLFPRFEPKKGFLKKAKPKIAFG